MELSRDNFGGDMSYCGDMKLSMDRQRDRGENVTQVLHVQFIFKLFFF